jgi:RNA polymerase-binding transcription factor DksA
MPAAAMDEGRRRIDAFEVALQRVENGQFGPD